jgi:uncharacterized protein
MSVSPVSEQERLPSLDVMRGIAVLGILAVNAAFFAAPWQTGINPTLAPLAVSEGTLWSWWAMHVFFEMKFITLFSLLFGASLYLIGGAREDVERGALLRRRLLWLAAFGVIHGALIWYGDILLAYALTGLMVLLARGWRARLLLSVGTVLYLLSLGISYMFGAAVAEMSAAKLAETQAEFWAPPAEELARLKHAYQGGLQSALKENVDAWRSFMVSSLPFVMLRSAGVMMIGMALCRLEFLSGKAPVWAYWLFAILGASAFALIANQASLNAAAGFDFVHMQGQGKVVNEALSIFGALFYATAAVFLVKAGARFVVGPLAAVGRMAFTNYLTQSLLMTTLFWGGRGFGLFGEVDRVTLWGIVVGVWFLQLIWSPLWFKHFTMGPLEWLWRRLSYAKPLAIGRAPQVVAD